MISIDTNLQMTRYIMPREGVDPHDLEYPGRHCLVNAQLLYRLNKSPVEFRRPIHLLKRGRTLCHEAQLTLIIVFFLLGLDV
jgi:hypothetical protein